MGDSGITYEELFDLLRSERTSEEIQVLNSSFYSDIIKYFEEKQKIVDDKSDQAQMFGGSEKEKVKTQLENAMKICKELIERREKKIILLALNKTRTNSDIIDTSALLSAEKEFFYQAAALFSSYKTGVMEKIVSMKTPVFGDATIDEAREEVREKEEVREEAAEKAEEQPHETVEEEESSSEVKVKFKSAVPKFLGRNEQTFGPYEEEEIATISNDVAEILISKGRAERV